MSRKWILRICWFLIFDSLFVCAWDIGNGDWHNLFLHDGLTFLTTVIVLCTWIRNFD